MRNILMITALIYFSHSNTSFARPCKDKDFKAQLDDCEGGAISKRESALAAERACIDKTCFPEESFENGFIGSAECMLRCHQASGKKYAEVSNDAKKCIKQVQKDIKECEFD